MENAKISSYQLFTLMYIFILGTTIIFPVGADAKQDAWIAILLGLVGGLPLIFMYYYLSKQLPNLLFTEYCMQILGKYVGGLVGIVYILFFLYGAARDVRDVMELVPLFLENTPEWAIGVFLLLPILFGLFLGIEVISRTSEILFPYILITGIIMVVFVFFSGIVKEENLRPVLESGWGTIIEAARGETWMAPFGEIVCFTMIFAYLDQAKSQLKTGIVGIIFGGIVLAFTHFLIILVLGGETRSNAIAPLLTMVQKINIGHFIQRLDSVFMVWLIVNAYIKITIFMYAAVIGGATFFKRSKNVLIILAGLIVLITSIFFADSYTAHMDQSDIVLKHVYPIFSAYIPLLLCIVYFIRQRFNKIGK